MNFFLGCDTIAELEAAEAGRQAWLANQVLPPVSAAEPATAPPANAAAAASDVGGTANTIYRALTSGPLNPGYVLMFRTWLNAKPGTFLQIEDLSKALQITVGQVQARFSKLSARLKRAATPQELAGVISPLGLLIETAYTHAGAAHRLTAAGREAADRYVKP